MLLAAAEATMAQARAHLNMFVVVVGKSWDGQLMICLALECDFYTISIYFRLLEIRPSLMSVSPDLFCKLPLMRRIGAPDWDVALLWVNSNASNMQELCERR